MNTAIDYEDVSGGVEADTKCRHDSDGGSALKFEDKRKMFVFLLSQQGNNLQQLTFDQSQIVYTVESTIEGLKKMIVLKEDENENIDSGRREPNEKSLGRIKVLNWDLKTWCRDWSREQTKLLKMLLERLGLSLSMQFYLYNKAISIRRIFCINQCPVYCVTSSEKYAFPIQFLSLYKLSIRSEYKKRMF